MTYYFSPSFCLLVDVTYWYQHNSKYVLQPAKCRNCFHCPPYHPSHCLPSFQNFGEWSDFYICSWFILSSVGAAVSLLEPLSLFMSWHLCMLFHSVCTCLTKPNHLHWGHYNFTIALDFFFFLSSSTPVPLNIVASPSLLWVLKVVLIRPADFFSSGHSRLLGYRWCFVKQFNFFTK